MCHEIGKLTGTNISVCDTSFWVWQRTMLGLQNPIDMLYFA